MAKEACIRPAMTGATSQRWFWAALLFVSLGGACSAAQRKAATIDFPVAESAKVDGMWEGFARETLSEGPAAGDTRIERQAWRLEQTGSLVRGYYVVELTMISGDGRPYSCSHTSQFQTLLRFEVSGKALGDAVDLEEIGDVRIKGECRPTFRSPSRFRVMSRGGSLIVNEGEAKRTLYRRPDNDAQDLIELQRIDASWTVAPQFPDLNGRLAESPATPTDLRDRPAEVSVEGTWVWEFRGTLETGDEKLEREEWHLSQEGTRLVGYYDRSVRQTSTDGQAFRCNNATDFKVVTRYAVAGEVRGNEIALFERGFEILEGSPCDSGQRRLDAYQGEAEQGEIRLVWGVGKQVLRRARPNVPTQRF